MNDLKIDKPHCPKCGKVMDLKRPIIILPNESKRYFWECKKHPVSVISELTKNQKKKFIDDFIERVVNNPIHRDGLLDYGYTLDLTSAKLLRGDKIINVDCSGEETEMGTESYYGCCPVCGNLMYVTYVPGSSWLACCSEECYKKYREFRPS